MSGFGYFPPTPPTNATARPVCAYERCGRPAEVLLKRHRDGKAVVEAACGYHRAVMALGGDDVERIPEKAEKT
jgi:hypothetical protein